MGGSSHPQSVAQGAQANLQGSVHSPWPTSAPLSGAAWAGTTGSSRVLLRQQPPNMDRLLGNHAWAQPLQGPSLCFSACSSAPTRPSCPPVTPSPVTSHPPTTFSLPRPGQINLAPPSEVRGTQASRPWAAPARAMCLAVT